MNTDTLKGNWKQLQGKIKERWGKLTDDHLTQINGKREQLAGRIQEAYGIGKDEAHQQIREFEAKHPGTLTSEADARAAADEAMTHNSSRL